MRTCSGLATPPPPRRAFAATLGLALAASALFALPARAQSEGGTITLAVGEQKVIQVSNVSRVAIGEPDVADVKQVGGGNELLITGVGKGRTSLLVWQHNERRIAYVIIVREWNPKEVAQEIRALLGDREGIQIRIVGDRLYLDGETLTSDDYERVQHIVTLYPNVRSFVRPSGNAKRLAAEALNNAFKKASLPNVRATVIGSTLFVEGWVEQKEDIQKVDQVAAAVGEKVLNLVNVGTKKMILVEVEFVEVQATDGKHVGVKFPLNIVSGEGTGVSFNLIKPIPALGDTTTQTVATFGATVMGNTDFSFGARFDHGFIRVLSQPKLLCASGEKAEFQAGGEIPILVVTLNQFAVEWKPFGVILKITPTADRNNNIGTEVYAEVSDIDASLAIKANGFDVPGFRKRDVKTNVTVHDGETVVLSGLFNYDEQKAVSKIPLLGHIPILGELFKSRDFTDRKTELAIYVTPRVVTPGHERVLKLIQDARELYKNAGENISFSLFD